MIYKQLSHHSGRIKGLEKREQINRKVFCFSKGPNFESRSIHKVTVHNYVFIAVQTIKLPCNFMVTNIAILRPQFCFGFVCLRFCVRSYVCFKNWTLIFTGCGIFVNVTFGSKKHTNLEWQVCQWVLGGGLMTYMNQNYNHTLLVISYFNSVLYSDCQTVSEI